MALNAAQLTVVSRLLDEALGLDAAGRSRWLEALPAEHEDLVPVLREMLARAETASGLLVDRPPKLRERHEFEALISTRQAGERVGPYELTRKLGAGGMAEVWLARRADGAYRRDLALKLPKLARLRKDLEQRFARECDILARLEHPHIARLYDAGVSDDGVPYLAMECVHGRPLTVWCDGRRVGLRERLNLFLQVIEAVQYAHDRQVIHRDLKPSNILVAESGEVRLLDFGVASLLEEEEEDRSVFHLYARALTPDYASPELLRGDAVDSTSDVYSLGAVLYELLAGDRPYRLEQGASAAQLEHAIASARVQRPSERVAPGAGIARATTQDRLEGRLRGELDAIALKALARNPADRYPTAAALAKDLERYLSGEQVEALPKPNRLTTEDLVAQLSRNPKVRVRARTAEFQIDEARSNAGAPTTVTRPQRGDAGSGKTLRISAQLVRTVDATHLWSQTYQLSLTDDPAMEDDVAGTVVRAINAALDAGTTHAERRHSSPDAYNQFVQGNFFRDRHTKADTETAIKFYTEAIRVDPKFAVAWAMLSMAHVTQAIRCWIPAADAITRSQRAVERALIIDPDLACAHEALGTLNEKFYWNWPKARAELERAHELDAASAQPSVRLAFMEGVVFGRFDAAISTMHEVLARNPLDTFALQALGWVQSAAGHAQESAAAYRQLLTFNPAYHGANASLALTLVSMDHHVDALEAARREPDEVARNFALPIVFWAAARRAESDAGLRELENEFATAGAYQIAAIHAFRGEADAAFEWLARAYQVRDPALPLVRADPLLKNLCSDSRYADLLVQMRLAG